MNKREIPVVVKVKKVATRLIESIRSKPVKKVEETTQTNTAPLSDASLREIENLNNEN